MCFSLDAIEHLLIVAVIVVAIILILKIFAGTILSKLGEGGVVALQVLNIILWAAIVIAVIIFVFMLLSCLLGYGHLPYHR